MDLRVLHRKSIYLFGNWAWMESMIFSAFSVKSSAEAAQVMRIQKRARLPAGYKDFTTSCERVKMTRRHS